MPDIPNIESAQAVAVYPPQGGLTFKEAAPMICGVVDNGVPFDDPRVMVRLNEATKIVLDAMIPVGGMVTADVAAIETQLILPPEFENVIEAFAVEASTKVWGKTDIKQGWYNIVNNSVYLDPDEHHDNPLIDLGLWPESDPSILRRVYKYPGLFPEDAIVRVTGAKRFIPIRSEDEYLIVQNVEALKCIILSIERYENNDPDGAHKYRQTGMEMLQSEVKKHILDPRNFMRRKAEYQRDLTTFSENTLGWVRASIALDVSEALKTGKTDLTWTINQVERRIMQTGLYKDCITEIKAEVLEGDVYFPIYVGSVLATGIDGQPIPVRSIFHEYIENGPGKFASNAMLIDQGDHYFPGTRTLRRKYKLVACLNNNQCLVAVCKLRWLYKQPTDLMVIKNYEAIRLMVAAKFMEEAEKWQEAAYNQKQAFDLLNQELEDFLRGIKHTPQIQTHGFGLGDVGQHRL
jgi:hypothetical protein